jgi:hypothetical protein
MPRDPVASELAKNRDLVIETTSWEDPGRSKMSAVGPCISDMTLEVEGHAMPLIRPPRFSDKTWDVDMDKIILTVGNERGGELQTITLTEYLQDFRDFLRRPLDWPLKGGGDHRSLLAPARDGKVLMSAQVWIAWVSMFLSAIMYRHASFQCPKPAVKSTSTWRFTTISRAKRLRRSSPL